MKYIRKGMHELRGLGDGYRIQFFFGQGAGGHGPGPDGGARPSASTGGQLAGGAATLQEFQVPRVLISANEAGSPQPETAQDPDENWNGEDLDNDHPDAGE